MEKSPPSKIVAAVCLGCCLCAAQITNAQTPPELTDIEKTGDTSSRLTIQDFGSGATGVEVQFAPDFAPDNWLIPNTSLLNLGGGTWQADVSGVDAEKGFFRVKLLGLGEAIQAYFDPSELDEVTEGKTATITVRFSEPYAGAVRYRWSGTAAIGNPTGVVQVNGTTAEIQLTLEENTMVDELAYLSLALETAGDTGYELGDLTGDASQISLTVADNDSVWLGNINASEIDLELVLELINDGGFISVDLIGSASSIFGEDETAYPASSLTVSDTTFNATFTGIPAAANDPNEPGANTTINIQLSSSSVTEALIQGDATVTINPGENHLASTATGSFTITRRPSAQPTTEITLIQ